MYQSVDCCLILRTSSVCDAKPPRGSVFFRLFFVIFAARSLKSDLSTATCRRGSLPYGREDRVALFCLAFLSWFQNKKVIIIRRHWNRNGPRFAAGCGFFLGETYAPTRFTLAWAESRASDGDGIWSSNKKQKAKNKKNKKQNKALGRI